MMSLYSTKTPKIISERDHFNLDQCALMHFKCYRKHFAENQLKLL